ncbi:GGDEF domain-containing protein [Nocardioides sp. zg-ZUI104]|uniref:GGDEF domain-containing protein n=1 Tax=Nocardioides faecalis TaxID=2803858 RepID=UPI001BCD458F|nr:GGDEF domain-containing protein [Nocardioides faecalis]MBS4752831.1 GGDEF domain-containing protein [Nocardioides faecalis]
MDVLHWLQPRDHVVAARTVTTLSGVAVTTALFTAPLQATTPSGTNALLAAALLALVVGVSAMSLVIGPEHRLGWALAPVLSVPALVLIDLLTDDATLTAQLFFLFPALYGASQLRPPGAAFLAVLAIAGEVVVVATQLPAREALVDAWYVAAAIGTTTMLLAIASERNARLVARLEEMAAVDPLTGLATRRVLDEAAGSALSGAGNESGTALILLDVDHFKSINDRHGHPAGDAVLVQLAALLRKHGRANDVACRLGGDEVALLMPACGLDDVEQRAAELMAAVREEPFHTGSGDPIAVSISIGCAHLPTHASDLHALYSAADSALYRAKELGRDCVVTASSADPVG